MKKFGVFLIILICLVLTFSLNKEKQEEAIYQDFVSKIKGMEYIEGYKILYKLSVQRDKKALLYISRAYLGDYGIDMDIVKSNIWKERSNVCLYCETGHNEFSQFQVFLDKKDYGMASVFLQKAAELGSEKAIKILKDVQFLEKNNLDIEPKWKKYWQNFDYDNLYPFCQEIEACRNDLDKEKITM